MEEALPVGRTVIPVTHTPDVRRQSAGSHLAPSAWIGSARVVGHRLVIVALAAFAILVMLPAAVAAQAAVPS